jgi:hypothetical protein
LASFPSEIKANPNGRFGSIASFWSSTEYFRSFPENGRCQGRSPCLKSANMRHERGRQLRRPYQQLETEAHHAPVMRFLWSTPYSLYRKGHAATSATRITAAASNTQRFMALRIAAKTGHCKNQIRPLGVKTGRYLAPHGNRLAIPEPFPKAAAYAHRMSVQGQTQKSRRVTRKSPSPLRTDIVCWAYQVRKAPISDLA